MASVEAAVRSKREPACLPKNCDSTRQCIATTKSAVIVFRNELEVVAARSSDLELEMATLPKEVETLPKTHAETKVGLTKDSGERPDD